MNCRAIAGPALIDVVGNGVDVTMPAAKGKPRELAGKNLAEHACRKVYDQLQARRGPDIQQRIESMIAVIFEVWPADGRKADYLDHGARLRSDLERVDGFISVERFQSLADPDKLLSLSFWRDEAAVAAWRRDDGHRAAQAAGRGGVFRDYRLRVASVIRDYGMTQTREQAPQDSGIAHNALI
jgi:heme-degrading monooxygenase HmoA